MSIVSSIRFYVLEFLRVQESSRSVFAWEFCFGIGRCDSFRLRMGWHRVFPMLWSIYVSSYTFGGCNDSDRA